MTTIGLGDIEDGPTRCARDLHPRQERIAQDDADRPRALGDSDGAAIRIVDEDG